MIVSGELAAVLVTLSCPAGFAPFVGLTADAGFTQVVGSACGVPVYLAQWPTLLECPCPTRAQHRRVVRCDLTGYEDAGLASVMDCTLTFRDGVTATVRRRVAP